MCRIFGISYGPGGWEAEGLSPSATARVMGPALVAKGPHAYGYMVNQGGDVYYDKWSGRVDHGMAGRRLASITDEADVSWLVGHTRWATHGDPKDNRNNHPLLHGNVIGVHNGVLSNHEEILEATGREDPLTEVDSEAIFAAVDHWGHRRGLGYVEGKMVTVYTHLLKPETLHVARTHGRELYIAKTVGGATIFASEVQAIEKTGLDLKGNPVSLNTNTLIRIREGVVRSTVVYRDTPAPKPAPASTGNGDTMWQYRLDRMRAISKGLDPEIVPAPSKKVKSAPVSLDSETGVWDESTSTYSFRGQSLSEAEYVSLMMDLYEHPIS